MLEEDSVEVVMMVALLLLESSRGRVRGLIIERREEALRRG
jgi:hypothetical protein